MSQLALSDLTKSFGAAEVIKGVTLDVEEGEFVVFVGPSGCGKSTLLRMIAGLEDVSSGEIVIGGRPVKDLPPVKRGIAMVFQSYALYPHMTVFENIAFPLRVERLPEADIRRRVEEAASVLQLTQRLQQKPGTLSGGQRQRVAIGRAIVRQPKIFLFDEPLSNLDAALRSEMRIELMRLHKSLGTTMIYVTHDQVEAMTMADKIVVLNGGRVEQVGAPLELYERPRNQFVAGFIGSPRMNFLPGNCLSATEIDLGPLGRITVPARPGLAAGDKVTVGLRPEHLSLSPGAISFTLRPNLIERLGLHTIAYSPLTDGQNFVSLFEGKPQIAEDADLVVSVKAGALYFFDAQGVALPPA
ncbi:sn-glycerol-3-phosphate ABC transporter ATP-binding protein UgpC [Frigidibacter sp. SD6-1]|uniref:ABC transporter ATP-binding protein n=1 Tax=Frigidibacter sp. SD6-1 TaxID=3032581 RepID=UPI0024DF5376|nr:sn-glycerol-3-phosphate ABC transporter ATP-binding protein UgpC [Frigidibacter sp. SD6-1]